VLFLDFKLKLLKLICKSKILKWVLSNMELIGNEIKYFINKKLTKFFIIDK
jgi:hypothetical protein